MNDVLKKDDAPISPILVATFYQFRSLPEAELNRIANTIEAKAKAGGVRGLMILGSEGLNTTISGCDPDIDTFVRWLEQELDLEPLYIKKSRAPRHPFHVFKAKIRTEIVTLGTPELKPETNESHRHLSPEEWHRVLSEEQDAVVIDTRNWYETRIGKFKRALDPQIEEFREFSEFIKTSALPKDKKILIYCTGGIRCEKAILEMERQGYENVYQLEGGILAYLEKFPRQEFAGECFVFDYRVAVDQELQPSERFQFCPHCGQPADQDISCVRCDTHAMICVRCKDVAHLNTCSKNCAHHYERAPGRKGRPQLQGLRIHAVKTESKHA